MFIMLIYFPLYIAACLEELSPGEYRGQHGTDLVKGVYILPDIILSQPIFLYFFLM